MAIHKFYPHQVATLMLINKYLFIFRYVMDGYNFLASHGRHEPGVKLWKIETLKFA